MSEKLQLLGYAFKQRIRMYGEEFDIMSNPSMDQDGFAVEAVSVTSGESRVLRIPLFITRMVCKELESESKLQTVKGNQFATFGELCEKIAKSLPKGGELIPFAGH